MSIAALPAVASRPAHSRLPSLRAAVLQPPADRGQLRGRLDNEFIWGTAEGQPWPTERLTWVLSRETSTRLKCRLTTQDYRHVAITIGRKFVGKEFAASKGRALHRGDEAEDIEEPQLKQEDELKLQTRHTTAIRQIRYGVSRDIVWNLSARSLDAFGRVSQAWHAFLQLDSGSSLASAAQQSES
ncbi:MAG: hypothetical protein M1819_002064 [Sarea resinae]|nr:MAG: hypothetical protein M1819_002064 [Sarea resinae]